MRQASNINKSLSALGNVIHALSDVAAGKQRHVHYRDSKLTFLLRDSLGGNSRTFVIATVSPVAACFDETLSTLKFARSAKKIRNVVVRAGCSAVCARNRGCTLTVLCSPHRW